MKTKLKEIFYVLSLLIIAFINFPTNPSISIGLIIIALIGGVDNEN